MAKKKAATKRTAKQKVTNMDALAEALGFGNRQTIARMKKAKGCPKRNSDGTYIVEDWLKFKEEVWDANKAQVQINGTSELTKFRTEREKIRVERDKFEFAKERGEYEHVDEINRVMGDIFSAVAAAQKALVNQTHDKLAGLEPKEAKQLLEKETRAVLEELSLGKWAKKKAFWSKVYATLHDLQASNPLGNG